ncbi:MAG: hypothetical protein MUO75_01885 [Actinobacteria bacterium]|nr:hypothetical protein [Actinomycetota bacterium]
MGEGLLLLGDSACPVIPTHGSGTASALIAADQASRAVISAHGEGRSGREEPGGGYCHAFQSGRGALLAYYYAVGLHTDRLKTRDTDRMIKNGILTAEETYSGLVPELLKLSFSGLLKKAVNGFTVMPPLLGFAPACAD